MTAPLPRGTVTFLFTDIEGSTKLLDQFGDLYTQALMRHRALLVDAVKEHGGVVVRTEGDALFVAFEKASAAIAAAIEGQRALGGEQWPRDMRLLVRMGLHAGEVDVVADDYVGMSVHVAARVSSAAHGGQILVTEETARLAGDPDTQDLGRHRMKDVGEFRLLQVLGRGLADSFPEPRTLSVLPNNLPAPVDSFVGRQIEMIEVAKAVTADRLVTLTGTGGSGKTRLALETAASLLPGFPDGVWLIELATVQDEERLVEAAAQAVRVSDRPSETIDQTLEEWLRDRTVLLILDNCEHVVDSAARFCDRFLPACPGLHVLATSREILGARGEHAISTPPLAVRDDDELVYESDAVRLFIARACAVAPLLSFDDSDLQTVAQVCRRLDGLPLAIELAAARMRSLSIDQLLARLGDRFHILVGKGDETSRQGTLEAVVAWSYDLLSNAEKSGFDRLSIFPDHFTLEMAEAVLAESPEEVRQVIDLVSRLVDKSLVSTVIAGDGLRYKMLETLRQYGMARLSATNSVDGVRLSLFRWATSGVDTLSRVMRTPAMDDALREATINAATYRSVLDWSLEHDEATSALRIASLVPIVHHRGERRILIHRCLEEANRTGPVDDLALGEAWAAIGNIAFEQADAAGARQAQNRAVEHFRAAGRTRLAAWAQYLDVHAAWMAGQLDEVDRLVGEAIAHFRQEDDEMGLGYSLWVASLRNQDLDAAREMAAEADYLLRRAGAPIGIAHNVEGRGIIAFELGQLNEAAAYVAEAVELFASYRNFGCTAHALEAAAVVIGERESARPVALELLAAAEEFRAQSGQGHRPWEIRARLGSLEERIAPSGVGSVASAGEAGRLLTLSAAAALATSSLLG